ncbi:glycoside hydrolase family 2 TIM barrel-domain containing protein [Paenibacillus glycanilyticus]|uniref:Beta-galactosidase n=1 Tax=Paenibacillus glycanilyticus TaxID=126569 RepID=A0ABQ6GCR7_9BACL|nr:glycoside hydrolase family 2 TIM barrel-domain containing protein [Paenibacillus glycanilyticus]GLX68754.1 beta-galactosidase [Paenibacillus glycanilyticus]
MNKGRIIANINLNWKFHRGEEPRGWYKGLDDSNWRQVTLPHDWSVEEPFSEEHSSGTGYLPGGIGWYRKSLHLPSNLQGKRVYITFEGVYNNSQVWCNSYYIGKRPYGYSSFTYDITDFVSFGDQETIISVKVDHKDIADSRWFTGSGIYRDVYLTVTDQVHIDTYGVFVTTPVVSEEQAEVAVNVRVASGSAKDESVQIRNVLLDRDGQEVQTVHGNLAVNGDSAKDTEQTLIVAKPKLWSPDSPYLYTLRTEILRDGEIIDQVETPAGIRWFEFDAANGFFLNGVNMKMKGVCVHHDAGALGAAVPAKVWVRRLEALKELGCNAIRMSHNPPASNLLDLCDRMGFLVIDEAFDEWEGVKNKWSTGHNVYPPKHFGYYEDFPQWGEIDLKEMVLRDRNHPSIIMWSIGNEVDYPNDPYCHPYFETMTGNNDANKPAAERQYDPNKPNAERLAVIARRLAKAVKECDTTRPVTAALAFPELSNLTGYAEALDIVGYNYKEHLYEEDLRKFPDRVTYGSENGSSLEAWLAVRDNDAMSGQFIWTGIDYLGEAKGWPVRVAGAGFMDTAGFKKTSYYYRQSLWSDNPVLFLTAIKAEDSEKGSRRWTGGVPHWNWGAGEQLKVSCHTNCEEVELFLNGRSLGVKKLADAPELYLAWETAYEEGTLEAVAKGKDGENLTCALVTVAEAARLQMKTDAAELQADGQDLAHVEIQVTDAEGRPVYLADHPIAVSIEGPGEIIGLENGDIQDLEPFSSRIRKAHRGKLLAYVRATTEAGEIKVTASGEGLQSCEATIQSIHRAVAVNA